MAAVYFIIFFVLDKDKCPFLNLLCVVLFSLSSEVSQANYERR